MAELPRLGHKLFYLYGNGQLINSLPEDVAAWFEEVRFIANALSQTNQAESLARLVTEDAVQRFSAYVDMLEGKDGRGLDPVPLLRLLRDAQRANEERLDAATLGPEINPEECFNFGRHKGFKCKTLMKCFVKFMDLGRKGFLGHGKCVTLGPDCVCIKTWMNIEVLLLILLLGLAIVGGSWIADRAILQILRIMFPIPVAA